MPQYLVYRNGSNSANQTMQQIKALCIIEAKNKKEACELAEKTHTFYGNQSSYAISRSKASKKDWESVIYSDGMANIEYCEPLPENIIATTEPNLKY